MDDGYLGEVRIFAGNFAPRNWAFCSGQLLPISSNSALFSILGTIYGGDGRNTFALPDLRARTVVGAGDGRSQGLSAVQEGQRFGTETTTLSVGNLPPHNHLASGTVKPLCNNGAPQDSDSPVGNYPSIIKDADEAELDAFADLGNAQMGESQVTVTVGNTGFGNAFNNRQPSLGIYYIICLQGLYPSRS